MQTSISPVAVFPATADTLIVDSFYGFPPSYRWALAQTISAQGTETGPSYQTLAQGNGDMTDVQWQAWGSNVTDDTAYVLACVAKNLKLTIVSP